MGIGGVQQQAEGVYFGESVRTESGQSVDRTVEYNAIVSLTLWLWWSASNKNCCCIFFLEAGLH